ncbi:MAG: ABC transporter permease [Euryarchaeota archaeon]|nr:ABC transporter permease [Euryarchaeota archaeon]MDE1835146.1 ABC transporter permease [Euryarchaeota archaeon]MDE1881461.1 ABC transporter permease [Euryarchaeota archaeon]MDE2046205.1 ABC transporter permease [Thermoplasmata archaeon]
MSRNVSDLQQFLTTFLYQLRFYLRTWRFAGILLFVAAISAAVLSLQLYRGVIAVQTTNPTSSDYLHAFLGNIGSAIIIAAAFLGGDAIAMDMGGGPGYLMLTQPVRRWVLLAGRYAAAALVGLLVAIAYYAFAIGGAAYIYGVGALPGGTLAESFGFAFLYGLSALALAFFFSSFFKSPAISIVFTVLIMIIALPIVTSIGSFTGGEPWYSLDYASGVISNLFQNPFVHYSTQSISEGRRGAVLTIYQWSPYAWEGLTIMVTYLVVFLVLAYVIYTRKEVKG